jgi:hypothetical protein
MGTPLATDTAAQLLGAQDITATPEIAEASARFATLVLGNSAQAFAALAFEEEPAAYTAALRSNAP